MQKHTSYYHELGCMPGGEIVFVIRSPDGRPISMVTQLGQIERAKADADLIVEALNAFATTNNQLP